MPVFVNDILKRIVEREYPTYTWLYGEPGFANMVSDRVSGTAFWLDDEQIIRPIKSRAPGTIYEFEHYWAITQPHLIEHEPYETLVALQWAVHGSR